jgi:NAD(P)-dependent dehydrogenase (short-subunit alcohol dehydrogenase family)
MNSLTGKVSIVTGASSGIGRVTALTLAKEGAKVIVASRREEEGTQTLRLIQEASGDGIFVKTDVTKEEDIKTLVNTTVEIFGGLDYAFNNAGIALPTVPLIEPIWYLLQCRKIKLRDEVNVLK